MDLLNLTLYIGNIFLLFLFFLPGTILESMEQNDNRGSSRGHTRKSLQLDLKTKNSMETIASMSSTIVPLSYYHTTATNTILLTTTTSSTAAAATPTIASTVPIKLLFSERKSKNDNSKQDNHYRRVKKQMMRRNLQVATDNNHEILKSNTTTARKTTAALPSTTSTTAKDAINEQRKQEQQTKKTATDYSYTHKYGPAQDHQHNTNTTATYSTKSLSMQEIFANAKYTGANIRNSLETTKYASNPFQSYHKDQQQQQQQQQGHVLQQQPTSTTTITRSNSSTYELYTDNPDASYKDNVFSIRAQERNNYKGSGSDPTARTATIAINSFNKTKRPTAITTTKPTKALTTKENRMYDNNSALTYLAYKTAALKASAVAFKTLNNNWNVFSNRAADADDDDDGDGIGIGGGNLKRDTLMSSAGMISTALAAVGDKNFMKNNTHTHQQQQHRTYDDDDENTVKNALKTQHNFKSNNSLAHATLAIKQTSQTTPTTAITKTKTKTTSTRLAINETSLTSASASASVATSSLPSLPSLPSNVSTTYTLKQTTAAVAATKEIPTTATSRTTLKTTTKTTKRRKIATTTLKPPPTIDDYQTITSQAGTHAYLPCNVKQLVKKPISWLRVRDGHILTVDQTTFIADQRFQSIFTTNPERWSLQIKYVQLKDAGIYECQVSTEPKASAIVYLHVVEPKTELIGAPTRHVKAGSQVKLLCIISQALEPPLFINWFYNQKQIYLHNRKGWHTEIERIELPPETTTTTTTTTTTRKTTTTTTTPSTTTTATTGSTTAAYPSNALLPTSSSMLNGSEIPAMHVFTSITPQQSLNDGNLLESVSESTYNNYYYPNLKQPEAASILTTLKTQTTATATPTTTTVSSSASASAVSSESIAGLGSAHGIASSILRTTTQPVALPGSETVETTTLSFNDDNDDKNNDDNDEDDDDDGDDDDYRTNPTVTTFETAEAIAAARGYMMLSSLMTVTDVKQITTASLIIPSVQKQDSGNYTCSPSNSEPRTVILHVLNGEYSASAITSTAALNFRKLCFNTLLNNLLILILIHNVFNETIFNTLNIIRRYSGG